MPAAIFSMKELRDMTLKRQANKFDINIAVSGARGNSKSSFLFKFLSGIPGFKPWKHQVYGRDDVIQLLESQKKGIVFDDEAVSSGFKRDFYEAGQKKLIKMLNMYRDNFNIYCSAIPQFYSLDRALRDLVKIHIHMIRRGMGVIHFSNSDRLYSDDMWDVKYNKKIEEGWAKKIKSNPNFHPPYHQLSTFKGYIVFGDLTNKQRELYEEIKQIKRKRLYEQELKNSGELNPVKSTVDFIAEGLINRDIKSTNEIQLICMSKGEKYSSICTSINKKLKDLGHITTITRLIQSNKVKLVHSSGKVKIDKNGYKTLVNA